MKQTSSSYRWLHHYKGWPPNVTNIRLHFCNCPCAGRRRSITWRVSRVPGWKKVFFKDTKKIIDAPDVSSIVRYCASTGWSVNNAASSKTRGTSAWHLEFKVFWSDLEKYSIDKPHLNSFVVFTLKNIPKTFQIKFIFQSYVEKYSRSKLIFRKENENIPTTPPLPTHSVVARQVP